MREFLWMLLATSLFWFIYGHEIFPKITEDFIGVLRVGLGLFAFHIVMAEMVVKKRLMG